MLQRRNGRQLRATHRRGLVDERASNTCSTVGQLGYDGGRAIVYFAAVDD
jgi:hypothetical protein